jgi:hypothetical protein
MTTKAKICAAISIVLALVSCQTQIDSEDIALFRIVVDGKHGYIDRTGKVVIEPQFTWAELRFSEGLAFVNVGGTTGKHGYVEGGKWGYIDRKGQFAIDPRFDGAGDFREGFGPISVDGRSGYVNKKGEIVIEHNFRHAGAFHEGLAFVVIDERLGFIDTTGDYAIEPQFEFSIVPQFHCGILFPNHSDFSEGLARVKVGDKFGFIDKSGRFVIDAIFDCASKFSEGLAWVTVDDKTGYIDKEGEYVIAPQPGHIYSGPFREGLALVCVGSQSGYIDEQGDSVIVSDRSRLKEILGEGRRTFFIPAKWGYMNKKGEIVIEPQFGHARYFHEGLAVCQGIPEDRPGKFCGLGYIDKNGVFVIEPVYREAEPFHDGLARVEKVDSLGETTEYYAYIDKRGKIIWKSTFRQNLLGSIEL